MKTRYGWLIGVVLVFLCVAFLLDLRAIRTGKVLLADGSSSPREEESTGLRTCDPAQTSFTGPLVPDQITPGPQSQLGEIKPADGIPRSQWSLRAGFGISSPTDPLYWAQMLGAGWYLDWNIGNDPSLEGLVHWSMVRVHEDCISPSAEEIRTAAENFPGQVWIIGNEPDVIWQDNVTPAQYASTYHDLCGLIKSADPTASVAAGGVSQATPLRLQYLDQVLSSYQARYGEALPADWWTLHGYVLREEKGSWGVDIPPGIEETQGELRQVSDHGRTDLFEAQIRSFRQWMAERGYQDTPLALTEFGILMPVSYGFPADMIADYLEQTFTWLSKTEDISTGYPQDQFHLVQKWAWFSISDPTYSSSDLGDLANGSLTLVGEKYRSTVSNLEP